MPPRKKRKLETKKINRNPPSPRTPPPSIPNHPPPAFVRTGPFNFFGLPRELRDMIYAYYHSYNHERIETIGESALYSGDGSWRWPLWTIRMKPTMPMSSVLVSRQFCAEAMAMTTVVLRMYDRAAEELIVSAPLAPPSSVILQRHDRAAEEVEVNAPLTTSRILDDVKPLVRHVGKCTARIDMRNLQYILREDPTLDEPADIFPRISGPTFKRRFLEALRYMSSLVSLEVEILVTRDATLASIERFPFNLLPIAELQELESLESVRIVFTRQGRGEELVRNWQREPSLRTA